MDLKLFYFDVAKNFTVDIKLGIARQNYSRQNYTWEVNHKSGCSKSFLIKGN